MTSFEWSGVEGFIEDIDHEADELVDDGTRWTAEEGVETTTGRTRLSSRATSEGGLFTKIRGTVIQFWNLHDYAIYVEALYHRLDENIDLARVLRRVQKRLDRTG